ncbi:lipopolysaccharide assembly protein LapA domain-containing protein [Bacillus safensis]|uniref:LapA family protein n=1 Tax=Bacillus safensis TaxID=561879 RepID=UPI002B24A8C7|nr:lipopolysaccharide assembly protein LapA domain-containing protein [Bacillus safensis]MEB2269997.1 lipopolysaccharide assembly protein LapA domain-containing protein [Bacillus safensis]
MNKQQWTIILAFIFVLIVSVFAVINVRPVEVDYLFGTAEWPLILVIIGSVLMGGLIVAFAGIFQIVKLKRELKALKAERADAAPAASTKKADKDLQKKTHVTPLKEQPATFDRKEK